MILVLFFLCVVPCHYSYSSLANLNTLKNDSLPIAMHALQALKKYGDPLSKEKKYRIIEADHAKSSLLEKGAFQYSMWLKYQQNPKDQRIIIDYMLYKTQKYALHLYISILQAQGLFTSALYEKSTINDSLSRLQQVTGYHFFKAQIRTSDFILSCWNKMYAKLCELQENGSDRLFTAQDMMSFTFLFAFLDDLAHKRKLHYGDPSFELLQTINNQNTFDHNKFFLDLISTYKEESSAVNFDRLKEWYGNQEYFIFPIFNKKGTIGLSVLIHAISSGIVLIGCGTQAARAHNNYWEALTDAIFHDLLHGNLPTRIRGNFAQPTEGELFFKTIAAAHVIELSKVYKKAVKTKENDTKETVLKAVLSLFYCLHEQGFPSFYFDGKDDDQIQRESVDKYIKLFLGFYTARYIRFFGFYNSNPFPYFSTQDALFRGVDMLLLYKIAYPELNNVLKDNGFSIQNGLLQNSDPAIQNNMDEGKLKIVFEQLRVCMINAWNQFYLDYRLKYQNTLPFEPCLTIYQ